MSPQTTRKRYFNAPQYKESRSNAPVPILRPSTPLSQKQQRHSKDQILQSKSGRSESVAGGERERGARMLRMMLPRRRLSWRKHFVDELEDPSTHNIKRIVLTGGLFRSYRLSASSFSYSRVTFNRSMWRKEQQLKFRVFVPRQEWLPLLHCSRGCVLFHWSKEGRRVSFCFLVCDGGG